MTDSESLAALKIENARLKAIINGNATAAVAENLRANRAESSLAALRLAVEQVVPYVQHGEHCATHRHIGFGIFARPPKCTCGLQSSLDALSALLSEQEKG